MAKENKQQKPKRKIPLFWKIVIVSVLATGLLGLGANLLGLLTLGREIFLWGGSFTGLTCIGTVIGEIVGSSINKKRMNKNLMSRSRQETLDRVPVQENSYNQEQDLSVDGRQNNVRNQGRTR